VSGDPVLGDEVHLARADLDLHRAHLRPDDGGVQRLVEVALRGGDVVLEAVLHRQEHVVHEPEHPVAVLARFGDDADPEQVVDLVELPPRPLHLVPDGVEGLGPAAHLRLDLLDPQALLQRLLDLRDRRFPLLPPRGDEIGHQPVVLRVEVLERQVVQLPLQPRDPQPVREHGVDLAGLRGDRVPAVRLERVERAHVVQAVGQLDQDDPDVLRHREEHLAEVLRLLRLGIAERDAADLRDAVDEQRDLRAELAPQPVEADRLVLLEDVVQQGRLQGDRLRPPAQQVGEDERDAEAVGDVRLARDPPLAVVRGLGELGRLPDRGGVQPRQESGQVVAKLALQRRDQVVRFGSHEAPHPASVPPPPASDRRKSRSFSCSRSSPRWRLIEGV